MDSGHHLSVLFKKLFDIICKGQRVIWQSDGPSQIFRSTPASFEDGTLPLVYLTSLMDQARKP